MIVIFVHGAPTMSAEPPVSVIMTVFNGEPFLAGAVLSILEQTYPDFELIVVDNGSTDRSLDTLRSFNDARLKVKRLEFNFGRTAVLNVALNMARGELVAVLDADDVARPERLDTQVRFLRRHEDVILLGSAYALIRAEGEHLRTVSPPTEHEALVDASVEGNPFAHSTVMYRRSAAIALGGYDWRFLYAQDMALWLRMMRRGPTAVVPEVLAELRVHPGQYSSKSLLQASEVIRLTKRALGNPALSLRARSRGRVFLAKARLVWLLRFLGLQNTSRSPRNS